MSSSKIVFAAAAKRTEPVRASDSMFYPLTLCALQTVFFMIIIIIINEPNRTRTQNFTFFPIVENTQFVFQSINAYKPTGISRKKSTENRVKRPERRKHCARCSIRWSQKLSPRRRPLPGDAGPPKFNQLDMVTTFTYRPSLVKIDARNFELSW